MKRLWQFHLQETLYWKGKALTKWSDNLSRFYLNMCLWYEVRRDNLLNIVLKLVPPTSVVYDIGAFIGIYSLLLARGRERENAPISPIYCFEPNVGSYDDLVRNINIMKLGNRIIAKNIALSSDVTQRTLYLSSYSARSSLYERWATYNKNKVVSSVSVECSTVDSLVDNGTCKPPGVLKIDTEGHEVEVLLGARNTISSYSPAIFIEPHGGNLRQIKEFLSQFGYQFKDFGYPIWCHK
ncbi:MAG: FkbM family methyltransferase [Chloroflexi bacterium]|nr:FkbM family methyltransferase [Chloroflexota bacterium]